MPLAHDIRTATNAKITGFKTNVGYFSRVTGEQFKEYMDVRFAHAKSLSFDERAAKLQLSEMKSSITPMGVKALLWFFNKSFRHAVRGLFVEQDSLATNLKD